jgi:hypothetical protein
MCSSVRSRLGMRTVLNDVQYLWKNFQSDCLKHVLIADVNLGFSVRKWFAYINLHRKDPLERIQYLWGPRSWW